jgi:chromosome segregation ATPase
MIEGGVMDFDEWYRGMEFKWTTARIPLDWVRQAWNASHGYAAARIAELEAQCESAHAAQRHAETELAQYMAWYAMAEHQHLHEKARAERAEANAANWEEQANDRVSDWDEVRAERDALKLRLAAAEDMNAACNADFSRIRAERDALRAAGEAALRTLDNVRVFVTSRERIHKPSGEEWFEGCVKALRAALEER